MAQSFKWLFVDFVPLLYDKRKVARQYQVEMWLNPSPIIKQLKMKKVETSKRDPKPVPRYIV